MASPRHGPSVERATAAGGNDDSQEPSQKDQQAGSSQRSHHLQIAGFIAHAGPSQASGSIARTAEAHPRRVFAEDVQPLGPLFRPNPARPVAQLRGIPEKLLRRHRWKVLLEATRRSSPGATGCSVLSGIHPPQKSRDKVIAVATYGNRRQRRPTIQSTIRPCRKHTAIVIRVNAKTNATAFRTTRSRLSRVHRAWRFRRHRGQRSKKGSANALSREMNGYRAPDDLFADRLPVVGRQTPRVGIVKIQERRKVPRDTDLHMPSGRHEEILEETDRARDGAHRQEDPEHQWSGRAPKQPSACR